MVVKCVKTSIPDASPSITNSDLEEYLKIGAEYEVYGIRISNKINYYMIFDGGHLIEVPSLLFGIIDSKVSSLWEMKVLENKDIAFWPPLFYQDDFFENFSDWENKERNEFGKLKRLFETSSNS